jgi:transposase InsO family protein
MLFQGESVYYDRAIIKRIYGSGFHLVNDLVPLYRMANHIDKYAALSREARTRIRWFDYHRKCQNVSQTARHFGISRKTFHKWRKTYNPNNLFSLENRSRSPINRRKPDITPLQDERIRELRKKHLCYSKFKIARIYENAYQEKISSWKAQRVIQKYKLYPNPKRTAKITKKRLKAGKKKRITELKKKPKNGFLFCLDTIEFRWNNLKRYVFTGIDHFSKVAFARMYKNANSLNAADFLNRLLYLLDGNIENIQTDNGSEFEKYFERGCLKLNLERYFNRPHTPKDNSVNERFNQTLQYEFVNFGNFTTDTLEFNRRLTDWLIEYNFHRPHETLDYETPVNFNNSTKVSPIALSKQNTTFLVY